MHNPKSIDVFNPPGWLVPLPGIGFGHVVAGDRSQGTAILVRHELKG